MLFLQITGIVTFFYLRFFKWSNMIFLPVWASNSICCCQLNQLLFAAKTEAAFVRLNILLFIWPSFQLHLLSYIIGWVTEIVRMWPSGKIDSGEEAQHCGFDFFFWAYLSQHTWVFFPRAKKSLNRSALN